jgi:predicted nucleotidyltransferase
MEWWVVGTVYVASYFNVSISTVSITCRLLREGYNLGRQEVYVCYFLLFSGYFCKY